MILTVTNYSPAPIVIGSPVGTVSGRATRSVNLVYSELEKLRPYLIDLAETGRVSFMVTTDPNASTADLNTDVLTAEGTQEAIAGGGGGGGDVVFANVGVTEDVEVEGTVYATTLDANSVTANFGWRTTFGPIDMDIGATGTTNTRFMVLPTYGRTRVLRLFTTLNATLSQGSLTFQVVRNGTPDAGSTVSYSTSSPITQFSNCAVDFDLDDVLVIRATATGLSGTVYGSVSLFCMEIDPND